ncbi:MAG: UPF0280 family protein [Cypionkella sp.]
MTGPQITRLADGRLHLHHGPIDLICEAWGEPQAVAAAYDHAILRFDGLLQELANELPALRQPNAAVSGPIARNMAKAVSAFQPAFITPMAAVAGAVAEAVLAAMQRPGLSRAYVNNGGDIALHLARGQSLTAAMAGTPHWVTITARDAIRGIATSGWRGRSFSFGIADSVTVLARSAAMADAAATMIANAVDLPDHPAIIRSKASDLHCDSDLGDRLVTAAVGPLSQQDIDTALNRGLAFAKTCRARGLIEATAISLASHLRTVGVPMLSEIVNA